uniref:Uncharacterized protein n=1 Tax=Oryza punctata TaxID=4537 RepID=A0A0E0JFH2_ORYPU
MCTSETKSKYTRRTQDTNHHLIVKLPPRRIVIKGTRKVTILREATTPKPQSLHQQGKQCQENNSPQLQRDSTLLLQCP